MLLYHNDQILTIEMLSLSSGVVQVGAFPKAAT